MAGTHSATETSSSEVITEAGRPPGPDGWPLLGNTVGFVRDSFGFYDRLAGYGDVVSYSVAGQPFCTVLHPEYVRQVLVTDAERYGTWRAEEFGTDFASEGVLMTDGEQWRRQRKALQPAFTLDRVRTYAEPMVSFTADRVERWAEGERIALNDDLSELTLRILAKSLFDIDVAERGRVVTEAATALNDRADTRNLSAYLPTWIPTPANRRYEKRTSGFEDLVEELLAERRADDDPEREDLLSLLLAVAAGERGDDGRGDDRRGENGTGMSDREIRDQLITFLFAGHETTSLALTYAFLCLARRPEKRAVLRAELDSVLDGRDPSIADLPRLSYTEKVLKEALRLYPPAYVIFRQANERVELGGYEIPAGTRLTLPQFAIQTDERFFEKPEEFRPERWTPGFEADLPDYAYFPFGGGPRHCIGMRFAMLELRLVLATIVRRADLELVSDPDPDLRMSATLTPRTDVEARVRKR
jgi:cytochrome P450